MITDDADIFSELRKHLGGDFRISLATTEDEIKATLEKPELDAIIPAMLLPEP